MLIRIPVLALLAGAALAAAPRSAPTDSASLEAGRKLYAQYCMTCHGNTGLGDGPTGKSLSPRPRNFQKPSELKSRNDEEMFKVISKGGPSLRLSPLMVPWGSVLKEGQIGQVVAYVRSLAHAAGGMAAPAR